MAKTQPVADVVEEMYQSILATPKRQRRLLSKTFWDKFGFKMRTKERIQQVLQALKQRGLLINLDASTFGTESKDDWIILTHVEQPHPPAVFGETTTEDIPTPDTSWFSLLQQRVFESEREVEYYFIMPLLEQLGYVEDDCAIGYPVQMYEGVKKVNKEADFVLFDGLPHSKDNALLILEAKKTERIITEDAVGQARGYALWLSTPYYLVTNGDEMRLYLFQGALVPDVKLVSFHRNELNEHWPFLYRTLNKGAVIDRKKHLSQLFDSAHLSK